MTSMQQRELSGSCDAGSLKCSHSSGNHHPLLLRPSLLNAWRFPLTVGARGLLQVRSHKQGGILGGNSRHLQGTDAIKRRQAGRGKGPDLSSWGLVMWLHVAKRWCTPWGRWYVANHSALAFSRKERHSIPCVSAAGMSLIRASGDRDTFHRQVRACAHINDDDGIKPWNPHAPGNPQPPGNLHTTY